MNAFTNCRLVGRRVPEPELRRALPRPRPVQEWNLPLCQEQIYFSLDAKMLSSVNPRRRLQKNPRNKFRPRFLLNKAQGRILQQVAKIFFKFSQLLVNSKVKERIVINKSEC